MASCPWPPEFPICCEMSFHSARQWLQGRCNEKAVFPANGLHLAADFPGTVMPLGNCRNFGLWPLASRFSVVDGTVPSEGKRDEVTNWDRQSCQPPDSWPIPIRRAQDGVVGSDGASHNTAGKRKTPETSRCVIGWFVAAAALSHSRTLPRRRPFPPPYPLVSFCEENKKVAG